jgi:predicted ABC-type ATPase
MQRYTVKIKGEKPAPFARFVWTSAEADAIFGVSHKFNPNHAPAGTPEGGQFTFSEGGAGLVYAYGKNGQRVDVVRGQSLATHLVTGPNGQLVLSPEREAIHQQIVDHFLAGAVAPEGQPELLMTGGGPASGKSTILREGLIDAPDKAVSIDPDQIKDALRGHDPSYASMVAKEDPNSASYVHEESSMISKEIAAAAIANGYNIILDTTGDTGADNLARKLDPFRAAGYKINAVYATTDVNTAVSRNLTRFGQTGRLVPEYYLRESHAMVSSTVPDAVRSGLFDSVKVYDTTSFRPKLIADGGGTTLKVVDQRLWDSFVAKADELPAGKDASNSKGINTDRLAMLIVAVMAGTPKESMKLTGRENAAWDALVAQCKDMPKHAIVDPGNEISGTDYSMLYAKTRQKFATSAGALDKNVQWVPIKKTDSDKQIVYGEVYAPYILDTYGEFMTPEDIELMAHRFMQLDLTKVIDTQHDNQPNGSYPVESFIAREGDPDYTPGSWVLGVHIPSPSLWDAVKKGLLNGFSFQSLVKPTGVDVEIDAIRDFVGDTELSEDHQHTFFVELDDIGNVVGGRTSKAADGHYHEIQWASVTNRTNGHSHRFFL